MSEVLWLIAVAAGPLLLAGVLAYVLMRNRRLTPHEQNKRTKRTRELFKDDT